MWDDKTIVFDGFKWSPEDFLEFMSPPYLPIGEFNRRASEALIAMGGDKEFADRLNKIKKKRFGSGFQNIEITTPQNEKPNVTLSMMPAAGRESKSSSQRNKSRTNVPIKPKTLLYYTHGNNAILMKQRKRVDIVFRLWNDWGWIDDETEADDFDRLWEGLPRHCNITWKANSTILTILLQELIAKPYIREQTGQAARSMVEQQFGMTANSDRKNRLTNDDEQKIRLTLLILDINNPLPMRRGNDGDEEDDTSEAALFEIFAGQLRMTKAV